MDYILLAGGMSRIPYVRQRLAALFPKAEIFQDVGFQADETIVAGLVNATEYNTINMYRPGIDFELTWLGEKRRLYTAYSPLFSLAQIQTGQSRAGYRCRVNGLPRHGQADLVIRTANGEPVKIRHTAMTKIPRKETVGLLPVRFGHHDVHFTFYCDGRVHLTDGAGHDHELRIEGWPIIRD